MSAGEALYKYFFKPTLPLRYLLSNFGLNGSLRILKGERSMKKAAANEKSIRLSADPDAPEFCFLTGKNYWHQTIFIVKSLHRQLPAFRVKIYSDGSLDQKHLGILKRFAPDLDYVDPLMVTNRLDWLLPKKTFPALRYLRDWHPFFKRLIDIHCSPGWSIHLDSDMLFFGLPHEIVEAFHHKTAVYMKEQMENSHYVDALETLESKFGMKCLGHVNGGIISYNNDLVDYADLEAKARILIDNYYATGPARIEQTLLSYLLNQQKAKGLADNRYKILYCGPVDDAKDAVVRHYIFKGRLPYLSTEWKKFCN